MLQFHLSHSHFVLGLPLLYQSFTGLFVISGSFNLQPPMEVIPSSSKEPNCFSSHGWKSTLGWCTMEMAISCIVKSVRKRRSLTEWAWGPTAETFPNTVYYDGHLRTGRIRKEMFKTVVCGSCFLYFSNVLKCPECFITVYWTAWVSLFALI